MDLDAVSVLVDHLHARQRVFVQIEERAGILLCRPAQCFGVVLQADDVFAHHTENWQMQVRVRETLDLVNIIRRRDSARAAVRKIAQRMDAAQIARGKVIVFQRRSALPP